MAAAHHELPEILRPDAGGAASVGAGRNSRSALSPLVAGDRFQLRRRQRFRDVGSGAKYDSDVAVLLREAEIAVREAAVADEFLERPELVAFPVGVVEILVKDDDRAGRKSWRQMIEHGLGGRIDVAVHMQEGNRFGMNTQ